MMLSGCGTAPAESSAEPSEMSEINVVSKEETSFVAFPKGISTYSKNKLQYTDGTISVIFTDEFYISNEDYKPKNGVYLQNTDGTATLLIETVEDNPVTNEEMLAYLYETYPYSEISALENNDIVSWYIVTDKAGNNIITFQRIQTTGSGYRQICLNCRQADKDKYQKIFNAISFS